MLRDCGGHPWLPPPSEGDEGPGLVTLSDISKRVKGNKSLAAGSGLLVQTLRRGSEWGLFTESRNFRGTCAPFLWAVHSELPILVLFNFFFKSR